MFTHWSVGKKVGSGFGVVLGLLAIVGVWSILGIGTIVGNAGEVIDGNALSGLMVQKEMDHLKWAGKVADLLSDDTVTELTVQTNPHECSFGKWYYGEERKQSEAMVPGLDKIMANIEEPHKRIHNSAVKIGDCFHQADMSLGGFLRDAKTAHLQCAYF